MNLQFAIASIPHLWPYFLLLAAYLFLSFQSELLKDRTFGVYALALLILFAGFRGAITPDMKRYALLYQEANGMAPPVLEPSFTFLSRLLFGLGFDYHALFFSYTAITLLCVYWGIRNYTSRFKLALLLFVLLPGYFLNLFVEMRELCAVAIAFLGTSLLSSDEFRGRKPLLIILAALSICFHYSAAVYWLILIFTYRFVKKTHSTYLYLVLLVGTVLVPASLVLRGIGVLAGPLLPGRYHGYLMMVMRAEASMAESGQLLKTAIYIFLAVCLVFSRSGTRQEEIENSPVSLNLFVIGVVVLNLTRSYADISRLAYYFLIYQIILLPAALARIKDKINRLFGAYVVVAFYLAQFLWGLFYYSLEAGDYPFLHYRNVLFSLVR